MYRRIYSQDDVVGLRPKFGTGLRINSTAQNHTIVIKNDNLLFINFERYQI
jgi:hypothetical protein